MLSSEIIPALNIAEFLEIISLFMSWLYGLSVVTLNVFMLCMNYYPACGFSGNILIRLIRTEVGIMIVILFQNVYRVTSEVLPQKATLS